MQRESFKGNQLTSWLAEWSVSFSFYPVRKWHVNRILVWAGFYFCQWLETCKIKKKKSVYFILFIYFLKSVYFSISRFVSGKKRQRWQFLNPLVVSVLKFCSFSPSAQSCWVAIAMTPPPQPVRLTGYRFSSQVRPRSKSKFRALITESGKSWGQGPLCVPPWAARGMMGVVSWWHPWHCSETRMAMVCSSATLQMGSHPRWELDKCVEQGYLGQWCNPISNEITGAVKVRHEILGQGMMEEGSE